MKLEIENYEFKLRKIIDTPEFESLQSSFNDSDFVFYFGHGGNMAIAEHAAIDASRLTDKDVQAPGGGVLATSIQGDTNFNDWFMHWLEMRTQYLDKSKCCVVGLSCSTIGASSDAVLTALNWSSKVGIKSFLIAATEKYDSIDSEVTQIIQDAEYYHTSELLTLALTYELIQGSGHKCPTISKKTRERRFDTLGIKSEIGGFDVNNSAGWEIYNVPKHSEKNTPPGMEDQLRNLAIDFDGVIHTFDKGWHDGTCYGDPIEGSIEAIKKLSENWNLIIFTAKVKPDRPLVDGKTGYDLVDAWLKKYGIRQYISEITFEKPRAKYYIDDNAIEFNNNWEDVLRKIL